MKKSISLAAILVFFLVVPFFIESRFWLGFWTTTLFFALLGQSWNILGGYGGQVSFGHAVFFGTGPMRGHGEILKGWAAFFEPGGSTLTWERRAARG